MAHQRPSLVSDSLVGLRVPLSPSREQREPVAAPEPEDCPYDAVKRYPSLKPTKKDRLVPFPVRLPISYIEALDRLREEHGVVPSELVRDAVREALESAGALKRDL